MPKKKRKPKKKGTKTGEIRRWVGREARTFWFFYFGGQPTPRGDY